jgi:coatomer protein complex subunit alpha (xenin)
LKTFQAARTYLSCNVSLPPLIYHVRRNPEELEPRRFLPILANTLQNILENQLQEAYKLTTNGKFHDATLQFKNILHLILLIAVSKRSEVDEVKAFN